MSHAGLLRVDHVMSLHRLFWIPEGIEARQGVYVRYPAEELYAVVCLESDRHGCAVVGEDLGTVPGEVRPAMDRHGIRRSYVLQFGISPDPAGGIEPVPPDAAAGIATHDLPTFSGFWSGTDIADRVRFSHVDPSQAPGLTRDRSVVKQTLASFLEEKELLLAGEADDPRAVMTACLAWLASGPAGVVLVDLEDLWLEAEPHNVPGTHEERPNWRRKAAHSFDEFRAMSPVLEILREVDRRRKERIGTG
jgi:4-alpha-glucanotransferase